MGRPRSFDEREVVQRACRIFLNGYNATSVDDLVVGLNLHRGSIYKAFGSKRGLFLAALRLQADTVLADAVADASSLRRLIDSDVLDLFLVAAMELAPTDAEVRMVAVSAAARIEASFGHSFAADDISSAESIFGARLWRRALNERTI